MKRLAVLVFTLLTAAAGISAQVQLSGYNKVETVWNSKGAFFFHDNARINLSYTNEDATGGAYIRLSGYVQSPAAPAATGVPEIIVAYGWADFIDHQIKISAGLLLNQEYTVNGCLDIDGDENTFGMFSNDNCELEYTNGIMLQFMPQSIGGLSAAIV